MMEVFTNDAFSLTFARDDVSGNFEAGAEVAVIDSGDDYNGLRLLQVLNLLVRLLFEFVELVKPVRHLSRSSKSSVKLRSDQSERRGVGGEREFTGGVNVRAPHEQSVEVLLGFLVPLDELVDACATKGVAAEVDVSFEISLET